MRQGCGHLRLIDLGSTTGALSATLPLPGGYQGIAFFLGHLSPHLVDLAAGEFVLPTLSLVGLATLPLASNLVLPSLDNAIRNRIMNAMPATQSSSKTRVAATPILSAEPFPN
jgi:hypothetical protein